MIDEVNRAKLVRTMLRPLLHFCLQRALGLQELIEIIKSVYVEVAESEIRGSNEKPTVSRLSVMTGVHRRDVTRILREAPKEGGGQPLLTRVIARWNHDSRFLTKQKKPKLLTFKGDSSEFHELVGLVSKDTGPAAVLFQLERLGLVERKGERIKIAAEAFHVHHNPEQGLALLAQDAQTLSQAIEENLFSPAPTRNLHLRTEYDNISQRDIPAIRRWLIENGAAFHRLARNFISQFDLDVNPKADEAGKGHVIVTSFSWTSDVTPELK